MTSVSEENEKDDGGGGFYRTFQKIISESQERRKDEDCESSGDILTMARIRDGKTQATYEIVQNISSRVIRSMGKPQRLIHDDPQYYIALDINTDTYYVCYRELLMIDLDYYKVGEKINVDDPLYLEKTQKREEELVDSMEDYALMNDLRFKIYRSRNGLHAFLVSKRSNYKSESAIKIMIDNGCDFFYTVYSYIRGWSVRVNRKEKEQEIKYTYIRDVGDVDAIEELENLTSLHLNLLSVFKDDPPSKMAGN